MASRAERKQILECKAKTTLQYSHDYFDYYYRDEPYPDIPARQDIFKTFPMPRWYSTRRPDPALNHSRPVGPQIQDRMGQEFWRDTRTDAGTDRELDPSVRQKLESLDIEIGKILGAGSQGLAIAIKFKGKNMVVKYATDIQSMVVEMWAMKEMVGARHIVQRRWIPNLNDSGVGNLSEDVMNHLIAGEDDHERELAQLLNIDLDDLTQRTLIYAMEYMKYGNMNVIRIRLPYFHVSTIYFFPFIVPVDGTQKTRQTLRMFVDTDFDQGILRKISELGARLKSRELWRVFYCLFRACVGLAYDGWDEGLDPETGQYIPTQEEFAPFNDAHQRYETHEGLIDFDMNERNVMLGIVPEEDMNRGEAEEHSHDEVPVFKVSDLGIVRGFRGFYRNSMLALASSRVLGNIWCHTPEQFSQAWNYYGPTVKDVETLNADETPGKYDWWTNLWQVARLMTIMITQYQPEIPPDCLRAPILKPGGVVDLVYTYGSELLDEDVYSHYDLPLRSTVAWCLAHRPQDRPTMDDMEQIIKDGIARNYPEENQEERLTMSQLLNEPDEAQQSVIVEHMDLDM